MLSLAGLLLLSGHVHSDPISSIYGFSVAAPCVEDRLYVCIIFDEDNNWDFISTSRNIADTGHCNYNFDAESSPGLNKGELRFLFGWTVLDGEQSQVYDSSWYQFENLNCETGSSLTTTNIVLNTAHITSEQGSDSSGMSGSNIGINFNKVTSRCARRYDFGNLTVVDLANYNNGEGLFYNYAYKDAPSTTFDVDVGVEVVNSTAASDVALELHSTNLDYTDCNRVYHLQAGNGAANTYMANIYEVPFACLIDGKLYYRILVDDDISGQSCMHDCPGSSSGLKCRVATVTTDEDLVLRVNTDNCDAAERFVSSTSPVLVTVGKGDSPKSGKLTTMEWIIIGIVSGVVFIALAVMAVNKCTPLRIAKLMESSETLLGTEDRNPNL